MRPSVLAAAFAAACLTPALAAPSRAGAYAAELCVTTQRGAAPSCGAAAVEVRGARIDVRVADIVYQLVLHRTALDVVTMHVRMQIDEFSAPYEWVGDTLRFGDEAKEVLYEVRFGAKRPAARR